MNRRDLFGGVCAFFAGLFGFSTAKAAPVEPIWGKQGEWVPYRPAYNDPFSERRVFYVNLPKMTPGESEKFLQKMKEVLRKKKSHV